MEFFSDAFLSNPFRSSVSIDFRKRQRERETGLWICRLGFPIALVASFVDYEVAPKMATADLILAGGLALSYGLSQLPRYQQTFFWWPCYLAFWYDGIITTLLLGGLYSPFLGYILILLLITGLVIQRQFKPSIVFAFVVLNFAFWIWVTLVKPQWVDHRMVSPSFVFSESLLFLTAIMGNLLGILRTEKILEEDQSTQHEELTETRDTLAHIAKMAEIGDLIAGTAHELAQPVQVISTSSTMMHRLNERGDLDPKEIGPFLDRMVEASSRMLGLLHQLRDFTRKDSFQLSRLDCREILSAVRNVMQFDFNSSKAKLQMSLPEHPLPVQGDMARLQQVFLNLANNARDNAALSFFPHVKIRAFEHGNWVRVQVTNNGPGVPIAVQHRLFSPYFTTKKKGKGTGLGLSISANFIQQHQGRILFSSQNDETIFTVDLPKATAVTKGQAGLLTRLTVHSKESQPGISST